MVSLQSNRTPKTKVAHRVWWWEQGTCRSPVRNIYLLKLLTCPPKRTGLVPTAGGLETVPGSARTRFSA